MARYYGSVGFAKTVESTPGVWSEEVVPRKYYGDVLRNNRRYQSSEHLNDDFTISNQISIIADPYAFSNVYNIRYVEWLGSKWKVSNVDVQYPRLILEVGGVYNGQQA